MPKDKKLETGTKYVFKSVRSYGSSKKKEVNLNSTISDQRKHINNWLKSHKYAVLATSYKNKPWAATVNYISDDDLNIYLDIDEDSAKYRNLINNPAVALVVDKKTKEGTLQMQGKAVSLKSKNDKKANFLIKPSLIVFRQIDRVGEIQMMILNLQKDAGKTIGKKTKSPAWKDRAEEGRV